MKCVTTILSTVIITLCCFALTLHSSCRPSCKDIICLNGGTCKKGKCECLSGYSGDKCEINAPAGGPGSDPCASIKCLNGGTCKDGLCNCPPGFEGKTCEIVLKDRYKGVWTVMEDGTNSMPAFYDVVVEYGTGVDKVAIKNLYNKFPGKVNASVTKNELIIPLQTVDGYELQGTGIYQEATGATGVKKITVTLKYKVRNTSTNVTDDFGFASGEPAIWER